jgi:tetratricopeptide (TPR) repeat protein
MKAVKDYSKAIKLDPLDYRSLNNRGYAFECLKDYKKAIEDYNKCIPLGKILGLVYRNRGNSYRGLR